MKKATIFLVVLLLTSGQTFLYAAQKTVKLTTYYPSPYGEYRKVVVAGADADDATTAFQASGSGGQGLVVTNAGVTKTEGGLILPVIPAGGQPPSSPVDGQIWVDLST